MSAVSVRNIEIGAGVPKICVPIVGRTKTEIFAAAENICKTTADIVEWRADWYEEAADYKKVKECLKELRSILGEIPLLFTFRTAEEGGEAALETEAYMELNQEAVRSGCVDLVDVELFTGDEYVLRMISFAHQYGVKVIASNHDFEKTPDRETIIFRLCKMQELGADILKIAVMPQSKKDVLNLLLTTDEMVSEYARQPVITMSMGKLGVISRLCGEQFGSAVTFGAAGKVSAPGQIEAAELKKVLEILH